MWPKHKKFDINPLSWHLFCYMSPQIYQVPSKKHTLWWWWWYKQTQKQKRDKMLDWKVNQVEPDLCLLTDISCFSLFFFHSPEVNPKQVEWKFCWSCWMEIERMSRAKIDRRTVKSVWLTSFRTRSSLQLIWNHDIPDEPFHDEFPNLKTSWTLNALLY